VTILPAVTESVEEFRMSDGVTLRATRWSAGHRRAILIVPGIFLHRESVEHRLLARHLSAIADVITVDVRGHGDSDGAFTWGVREPEDIAAAAAALRARYDRVGGLGFSFGGHHVGLAAAVQRPFDAVALVAAPRNLFLLDHNFLTASLVRSLPLIVRRQRRATRVAFPRRRPPSLLRAVEGIAPTPLLIAHGLADWLVPPAHARALFARAGEPKSLVLLERALHSENILVDHPEPLLAALSAFFDRTL
jgi:pimeloyl-ACP methyl ester carboxylesterase